MNVGDELIKILEHIGIFCERGNQFDTDVNYIRIMNGSFTKSSVVFSTTKYCRTFYEYFREFN